jgi:hypothetical protein
MGSIMSIWRVGAKAPSAIKVVEGGSLSESIAVARKSLEIARACLDDAVSALPEVQGDRTMATPGLIALLLRAVAARRHLNALETIVVPTSDADRRGQFPALHLRS